MPAERTTIPDKESEQQDKQEENEEQRINELPQAYRIFSFHKCRFE